MLLEQLKWDAAGLVTVVVQDRLTGELRMLAHADRAAIEATVATGYAHFYSRSRGRLWRKGESSGHGLRVTEVWADCDGDALVYLADSEGPSCHTQRETCFFSRVTGEGDAAQLTVDAQRHARPVLPRLWAELQERRAAAADTSYTKTLLSEGSAKIAAKLEEEAGELARALQNETDDRVISEAADVTYHMLVAMLARNVSLRELEAELAKRFAMSGLQEKASRAK
jgi:phosphoribosyl-AMP cyclohydrolase / phosphoribosyl-ATP pyrophosphohydrolase